MASPNLDEPPAISTAPIEGVHLFVAAQNGQDLNGFYDGSAGEFTTLGLTVIERFEGCRSPLGLKGIIDDLTGTEPEGRSQNAYDMDAIIAATAIEVMHLTAGITGSSRVARLQRFGRQIRYSADGTYPHLKKLRDREPFRSVSKQAILRSRDSLVDDYIQGEKLKDPETRFFCAQLIGTILSESLSSTEKPQDA